MVRQGARIFHWDPQISDVGGDLLCSDRPVPPHQKNSSISWEKGFIEAWLLSFLKPSRGEPVVESGNDLIVSGTDLQDILF